MRFLPRSAVPIEPLDAVGDGEGELSLKAQTVLGAGQRSTPKSTKTERPDTYVPTGSPPRRDEQSSPSPMLPPLNPTEPLSFDSDYLPNPLKSNPPTATGKMSPFPNMQAPPKFPPRTTSANDLRGQSNAYTQRARQRQLQPSPSSAASSSAVQPHQFYPDSKPSVESFETRMRDYYDASTQPLSVSQQTSASAVRDHGLRKGAPMIAMHETSSDPTLVKPRRPLKSAMKSSQQETAKRKDGEKKGRRLDIGSLFSSQPKPASLGSYSPSPVSARTEQNFDFFPDETVHVKLQRPKPHARFATQKSVGTMSTNSDRTVREKVFEKDVYDSAKMNVRRPPKGIKNWFDGFEISSDEEEKIYMREKDKVRIEKPPVELPATEAMRTEGPLPSTFSPYDGTLNQPSWQKQPQRPPHNRKASLDPVEDNILAIEHAKELMKRRVRDKMNQTPGNSPPSAKSAPKKQRENESRLAHSRLGSQSILSLSSESADEEGTPSEVLSRQDTLGDESIVVSNAASIGMHRPVIPPRQLHAPQQENTLRRSISTEKTSGSIPMRLGSDVPVPVPPIPADRSTLGSPRAADSTAQALRRLNGLRDSTSQPSRSRRTTRSAVDDAKSTAGRSMGEETTSSATDGSRMMQVSEEEMILLELMRQKRAAMQKDSFSEGYRLALKQEQEHLAKRREGAHRTALQILKAKEELSKRQSATSTVFSEDHENPAIAALRRKYSALHKEDVDKALKLERFLSLDPHGQVQVVPGADHFPNPTGDGEGADDEDLADPPVLLQAKTYSPMQKLTEKVRDGGRQSAHQPYATTLPRSEPESPPDALSDEYMEDHHGKVRAFLASSSASEAQDYFPTPPSHSRASMRQENCQRKRESMMSPSPVPEEEPVPDDEDDGEDASSFAEPNTIHTRDSRYPQPLQPRLYEPVERKRSPHIPTPERRAKYRLSYTPDSDPLLETIVGLAPPPHKLRDPYPDITPTLDAGPLELPTPGFPGSPSLSSRPSPVTPTFPQVPTSQQSDKTSINNFIEIAGSGSDNASYRGDVGGRAYTPDTEFSAPGAVQQQQLTPASSSAKKFTRRGPPPSIDAMAAKRGVERSSVGLSSSITSAGEDVLAAWAELGGGSSDFAFRKVGGRSGR